MLFYKRGKKGFMRVSPVQLKETCRGKRVEVAVVVMFPWILLNRFLLT